MDTRAKQAVTVAAVAAGLASAAPAAADDVFLTIPGVPGDSNDLKHRDEIDVLSWSWGPATTGTGAQTVVRNLTITKRVDRASPELAKAFSPEGYKGMSSFKGPITLTVRRNGRDDGNMKGTPGSIKDGTEFLKLAIKDARVVSIKMSQGNAESRPVEEITFSFTTVAYTFTGPNGTTTTNINGQASSYDLKWGSAQ